MQVLVEGNYRKHMMRMREKARKESFEIGREEGRQEGLRYLRNMLRRVATARFDDDAVRQLAVLLEHIDDPYHLEDIAEWAVNGYTKAEFLRRVEGLIP